MSTSKPETWLLLRGLGREQAHWFEFPELAEAALGARIVCLDLPGTGTEWQRPAPVSVMATARDVAERLRQEYGVPDRPWGILGLSFGAMVSLGLGEAYPNWFSHLVTINTSCNLSMPHQRLSVRAALRLAHLASIRDAFEREKAVFRFSASLPEWRVEHYARLAAEVHFQRPVRRTTIARQLAAAAQFRPAALLAQRVLVLSSESDGLVCPDASDHLAAFIRAPHICHPTAAHDLPLDDPAWVLRRTSRWLDLLTSRQRALWSP